MGIFNTLLRYHKVKCVGINEEVSGHIMALIIGAASFLALNMGVGVWEAERKQMCLIQLALLIENMGWGGGAGGGGGRGGVAREAERKQTCLIQLALLKVCPRTDRCTNH